MVRCGLGASLIVLSGCAVVKWFGSGDDVKCETLPIEVLLKGADVLNLNREGQPMPVRVKVAFLNDDPGFDGLDFRTLWADVEGTLGSAVVKLQSMTLYPGDSAIEHSDLPLETSYVMIVASFRRIESGQWWHLVDIREAAKTCKPGSLSIVVSAELQGNRVIAYRRPANERQR